MHASGVHRVDHLVRAADGHPQKKGLPFPKEGPPALTLSVLRMGTGGCVTGRRQMGHVFLRDSQSSRQGPGGEGGEG